ncbi:MAG: PAS domain S-box protein [Spirochaetaceae bacterium]
MDHMSVLILDSDPRARTQTAQYLSSGGVTVFGADTAERSLVQLTRHPEILVVLVHTREHDLSAYRNTLRRTYGADRTFAIVPVVRQSPDAPGTATGDVTPGHMLPDDDEDPKHPLSAAIQKAVERNFEQITLREQILRNHALMRVIPDAVFVLDSLGVYQEVHAPDPQILMRPPAELIGKSVAEIMGRDVLDRHLRQVAEAREAGESHTPQPFRYSASIAGEHRHFESLLALIDDERSLVMVRDVTAETRYLSQQREHSRYQATVHAVSRRFVQASPETVDEDLLFAMKRLGKHLGADWVTLGLADAENDVLRITHHWRRIGPSFPPVLADSGPREVPMDLLKITKAMERKGYFDVHDTLYAPEQIREFARGLERYCIRSLVAFPLVERQTTVGALIISSKRERRKLGARDITLIQVISRLINDAIVAQRSQRRVEQTAAGFEALFGFSFEGLLIQRAGTILETNPALCRMFGCTNDELRNRTVRSLIDPDYESTCLDTPDDTRGSRRIVQALHRDGTRLWVEMECRRVALEDGEAQLVAFHDISHHKEREAKIENLLHEKERLIRDIHHRLKNQMLSIESLLSLKSRESGDGSAPQSVLSDIQSHVRSMTLLYDRLYRSVDGTDTIPAADYLPKLATDIVTLSAHQKELLPEIQVDDISLPVRVLSRIGMILNELISNTVKHAYELDDPTGNGRPGRIEIRLTRAEAGLTFVYTDDGRGIADTAADGTATGLGMELIRAFAEELGARLSISGQAPGTVVKIEFPYPEE